MSLSVGTRIGPYEVTGMLGALANDTDLRERFEREAKAVAALSHPNTINIFDTGVAGIRLRSVSTAPV